MSQSRVLATYRNGILISGKEETTTVAYFRVDYYRSTASQANTGPGTGANAPTPDPGRWQPGVMYDQTQAEALYQDWATSSAAGIYKRVRLVEVNRHGVIIRVIKQSNGEYIPEGGTEEMEHEPQVELHVKPSAMLDTLKAEDARRKEKWDKAQAELKAANSESIEKVKGLCDNPWLLLQLFERCFAPVSDYDNGEAVVKAAHEFFGEEPGAIEYTTDRSLQKWINLVAMSVDEQITIRPSDDLFRYISDAPAPTVEPTPEV